jgi:sugar phosphate isomerase/epimerase
MSRRALLSAAAAGGIAAAAGCAASQSQRQKLGIQLYMLGPEAQADLLGAFRAVAEIGYEEIELPARSGEGLQLLRQALDESGLACPSIHAPTRSFPPGALSLEDAPAVIEAAQTLGARYVVVPFVPLPTIPEFPPGENPRDVLQRATAAVTAAEWSAVADRLNAKGAELARAGLRLGYHNHALEFVPVGEGTLLDFLIANTDPDLVDLELDIGWVAAAGFDPAEFITRHAQRVKLLHVKDIADVLSAEKPDFSPADVGAGRVDWSAVLAAAKAANVQHYFAEQEPPYTRPPLESARAAHDFLRPLL